MNPALSGAVSDSNSCTGTVMSITAGSLGAIPGSSVAGLEDPKRMRTSASTVSFPQGRGLILENIDGFPPTPHVFRKSPHLLNLNQRFGPFGLSGSVFDLQSFATGAVIQHFPRTLARNSGGSNPDFRLPTSDELAAMEAFMRAQEFPAGTGPINTVAIGPTATDDIIAFLEGISFSPFAPTFGAVGTGVTITGTNFTGATAVSFNGVAATFTEGPPGTITTTVPAGATTGDITVTTPGGGPLKTTTRFTVTPAIASFAPTLGSVGTGVTITGTTFTGATAVSFHGVASTFTVSNSGTVTATVPTGASTGPITVTTLDGTATSAANFTVSSTPFSLGATPSSQTVSAGATTSYTVTISRTAGFADNLTFIVTGLPAATTASFSPNPTSVNSSTLTVTTTARSHLA